MLAPYASTNPFCAKKPAVNCIRTVPEAACQTQDDAVSSPTEAFRHISLLEGEILENEPAKTATQNKTQSTPKKKARDMSEPVTVNDSLLNTTAEGSIESIRR